MLSLRYHSIDAALDGWLADRLLGLFVLLFCFVFVVQLRRLRRPWRPLASAGGLAAVALFLEPAGRLLGLIN